MFGKGSTLAAKVIFIKVVPLPLGVSFLGNGGTVLQSLSFWVHDIIINQATDTALYDEFTFTKILLG